MRLPSRRRFAIWRIFATGRGMTQLSGSDLHGILDFIREVDGVSDLTVFPDRMLAGLARLIPSDVVCYDEMSERGEKLLRIHLPFDAVPDDAEAACDRLVHQHPMVNHYFTTRDSRALTASDFLSRREFRRLELYQDCYRLVGWEYQLAVLIPSPRSMIRALMFNRQRRDYGDRDRAVAALVRPHIAHAHLEAQSRMLMNRLVSSIEHVVADRAEAFLLLSRDATVAFATSHASDLLSRYYGSPSPNGSRLPDELEDFVRVQRRILNTDDGLSPPTRVRVDMGEGGHLFVRFLPQGENAGYDTLLLREESQDAESRLSRRELEVLRFVAEGFTNRQIAETLFVSQRTVQKHLEHLFAKLGVHTRMAAARAINQKRPIS